MFTSVAVVLAAALQGFAVFAMTMFVSARKAAKERPTHDREVSMHAAEFAVVTMREVLDSTNKEYEARIKRLEYQVALLEAENQRLRDKLFQ